MNRERMGVSLAESLRGVREEDRVSHVVEILKEDLCGQAMLHPDFSGGDMWRLMQDDPRLYMDLYITSSVYYHMFAPTERVGQGGQCEVELMPPSLMRDYAVDVPQASYISSKLFSFQEKGYRFGKTPAPVTQFIGNEGQAAMCLLRDIPRRLAVDLKVDMLMPPEGARIFGEVALDEYRERMVSEQMEGAALVPLYRVCLFPMPVRLLLGQVRTEYLDGDYVAMGDLSEVVSGEFCGYNISLDLALYCALVNYQAALTRLYSPAGLTITGPENVGINLRLDLESGGIPKGTFNIIAREE